MKRKSAETLDLFTDASADRPAKQEFADGAFLLGGFALQNESALLAALRSVTAKAPFRHMITPGGYKMSVAMTNCGSLGWVTDRSGYRYDWIDRESGQPWPAMPEAFLSLAINASRAAGFSSFHPDACLVNRYEPGTKLSLHQDKDEKDFSQPIVSVSLGVPATFLFGGVRRADKTERIGLRHGDVVVWGGPARLRYHGVSPVRDAVHPLFGNTRINLTFRKAA
jgi:alkylated DNA repair protein (DNA oxidative demethylase)